MQRDLNDTEEWCFLVRKAQVVRGSVAGYTYKASAFHFPWEYRAHPIVSNGIIKRTELLLLSPLLLRILNCKKIELNSAVFWQIIYSFLGFICVFNAESKKKP